MGSPWFSRRDSEPVQSPKSASSARRIPPRPGRRRGARVDTAPPVQPAGLARAAQARPQRRRPPRRAAHPARAGSRHARPRLQTPDAPVVGPCHRHWALLPHAGRTCAGSPPSRRFAAVAPPCPAGADDRAHAHPPPPVTARPADEATPEPAPPALHTEPPRELRLQTAPPEAARTGRAGGPA